MRGPTPATDYIIGTITSPNYISVTKTSNRVTFSTNQTKTFSIDQGIIEIPIEIDGIIFFK